MGTLCPGVQWSMPVRWWTKLPSLAPVKGVSNFLYNWTHRNTITEEQKKRGQRLEAIEEFANQMVRLKEQAHEEEKRVLEQTLEHKQWRTLASRSADLVGKRADTFDSAIAEIEGIKKDLAAIGGDFRAVLQWLAIVLYALDDPELRDHILSALSPPIRAQLTSDLARVEEHAAARGAHPAPSTFPDTKPPPLAPPTPPT
jgi:hypothetical protein